MKHSFCGILLLIFIISGCNSAFSLGSKKKKAKNVPKQQMVETKQEWLNEAKNVPLSDRKLEEYKYPESTKKIYYPEPQFVLERYNNPPGSKEVNIDKIKESLNLLTNIVTDSNCTYGAYSIYYFSPEFNQISSAFFVEKLDESKSKTKRILNYIHNQKSRTAVLETGTDGIYSNLYNGLSIVDWSPDSRKILIKEKIGSLQNGIYKTILYVYFLSDDPYTLKLDNFDEAIRNYFLDWQNMQLIKYRYDITPLGFSADDENIIVSNCYAVDNENNKVFLGVWGYNISTNQTILISKNPTTMAISSNGLYLKQVAE